MTGKTFNLLIMFACAILGVILHADKIEALRTLSIAFFIFQGMFLYRFIFNESKPLRKYPHYKSVEWLKARGYEGLHCDNDCACDLNDWNACGDGVDGCEPGYKTPCDCGDHDYHITSEKPKRFHRFIKITISRIKRRLTKN